MAEEDKKARIPTPVKRMRQNDEARLRNKARKSALNTWEKKFRAALAASDFDAAETLLRKTISLYDKAAKVGTIHRNRVSRKKSRLMDAMNAARQAQ